MFSVVAVVILFSLRETTKPTPAILLHPRGDIVVAAFTKQDMEYAMEISKKASISYLRGMLSNDAELAFKDIGPIQKMLSQGRLIRLANGTKCIVTSKGRKISRICINQGQPNELTCWVYNKLLN
jgi:hypothetical protein